MSSIDPITLAVVRGAFLQIADEMDAIIVRAAFSQVISEQKDRASGLFDPETGEVIAQGSETLPIFMTTMQFAVQTVIEEARKRGGFKEGDVYILNNPYDGGTHLPDMKLVMPVYSRGKLVIILAVCGHWSDIGGMAAGGFAPNATEIYQEGVLVNPTLLYDAGVYQQSLVRLILDNVRLSQEREGDLRALLAALRVGAERFNLLIDRYGAEVLHDCARELNLRSERHMRLLIEGVPDGVYVFEDSLDNDGHRDQPLPIRCAITVSDDSMTLDFTGSSAPAVGPMNIARKTTICAVQVALKHLFPEVDVNGGCYRSFRYVIPDNCLLSATHPRATSGYPETVGRVISVVTGAMSKALPDRVPADWFGVAGVITISGKRPENGSDYIVMFVASGGYGGHPAGGDGLVNGPMPIGASNFPSAESVEHHAPMMVQRMALREGSGGAGRYRGGCGTLYEYRMLAPDATVFALGDRHDFKPFGVSGGKPAEGAELSLSTPRGLQHLPFVTKGRMQVHAGDILEYRSPGGGGFGDPLERPCAEVLRDVRLGYIDEAQARDDYGVVIRFEPNSHTRSIDEESTRQERRRRSGS